MFKDSFARKTSRDFWISETYKDAEEDQEQPNTIKEVTAEVVDPEEPKPTAKKKKTTKKKAKKKTEPKKT